ncbi:MAG: hypothetical protein KDI88_17770 [Gammaproteobacteria bacterium]|nr:hypothetical protein [Gammaproteobacteria bacterium]
MQRTESAITPQRDQHRPLRRLAPALAALAVFAQLHTGIVAAGPYDGIWHGPVSVTGNGSAFIGADTYMALYQVDDNTMHGVWENDIPLVLTRSGDRWIRENYSRDGITVTEFGISFPLVSTLNGGALFDINLPELSASFRATFQLSRNNCTALTANPAIFGGLSGAENSDRCYTLSLPACASGFNASLSGGSGDADLIVGQTTPPFSAFDSANPDNEEQVQPPASSGDWYVIVQGFDAYSGVTLTVGYNTPDDSDGDGISDCIDSCPATVAGETVDAMGCADAQRDDDNDGVLNATDNCPLLSNPGQGDNDDDGLGDPCDSDDDNDRLSDEDERNLYGTNPLVADTDRDGIADGDEIDAGSDPLFNPRMPLLIINQMLLAD